MKFAIIGGGIGGLTIAYRLAQKGHIVKLFEQTDTLGGLARTVKIGDRFVEVYYHHYNKSDSALFNLCKELDIKITSFNAPMGYLSNGVVYDFNTPFDLLKFKPLNLMDKVRFGIDLYFNVGCGKKVYEVIWKPLLIQKFGAHYMNIPMSYIYSRPKSNGRLYYMEGSTQVLIDKLKTGIEKHGGEIFLKTEPDKEGYTAIIDTTPQNNDMLPVICVMFVLRKPLMKYYWLNVGDLSFPFGHIIQKDNLLYITKYGEVKDDFTIKMLPYYLNRINPDFRDDWILESYVFNDKHAQQINVSIEERGLNKIIAKAEKTVLMC